MRYWLAAILALLTGPAFAQTLVPPGEIVIYVHKDLPEKDADFVEGLVCELSRVVAAPVRAAKSELPLNRSDLATPTQLDANKVRRSFARATAGEGPAFRYLILPYDLKVEDLHYVFALTVRDGETAAVMSTIRLVPREPGLSRKRVADITSDRIYKLMLKSIAVLAGLHGEGCIMAFPRSLPELDAKSDEFCPEDKAALIAAGVLKARPSGACNVVAMAQ
jgi:predicted Zn-dependent protease